MRPLTSRSTSIAAESGARRRDALPLAALGVLAALVLSAASCAGPPSGPDAADLSGMWAGTVPRGFYLDTMRLELVQSGRALAGQGVRGLPCPADKGSGAETRSVVSPRGSSAGIDSRREPPDGTCYADVVVMGTVSGSDVVLSFAPPFGDRFVGRVAPDGSLMGTLTGYSDRPQLTLSRIRE